MLNKTISLFLIIIAIAKIVIWLIYVNPISRGSMIIIFLMLLVLNIKNKFTWLLGLLIFLTAALFNEETLKYIDIVHVNIFNYTKSLFFQYPFRTSKLLATILFLIQTFIYIVLFFMFLTRYYRVKYGINKAPKKWSFWNRIF